MSRRNTISREFFATIAAVLVLGLSVMCAIQTALSAAYFIGERKSSLTDVLNGATALSERFADEGSIVTKPLQGEDVLERAHSGFELFNTASGALVFIADENGQILLHTGDDAFTGADVPASYIDELLPVCRQPDGCAGQLHDRYADDVRHLGGGHPDFVQHPVLGAGQAHHRPY